MKPVEFSHKEYTARIRRNPQNDTYVVFVYKSGKLIERTVFSSYEIAEDYAYRVVIVEDLCDSLGLR